MLIDIKDIAHERLFIKRVIDIGSLPWQGERIGVSPVRMEGFLSRAKRGIEFSCRIGSQVSLVCSRCLEEYHLPIDAEFHLVFVPEASAVSQRREAQVGDGDCDLYPVREGKVDLSDVTREQIYLSIPLKPLCREECQGLCPKCGTNLNVGACSCERAQPRPRNPLPITFDSLKSLKQ